MLLEYTQVYIPEIFQLQEGWLLYGNQNKGNNPMFS